MNRSEKKFISRQVMNASVPQHVIIPMTPAEEMELAITYATYNSTYGPLLIASSSRGILFIGFGEEDHLLVELKDRYPTAVITPREDPLLRRALALIEEPTGEDVLLLHLRGTTFQMEVWEALLQIPYGKTTSYATLAKRIGRPAASRAVGSAVGKNPVACLIPCHRVLRSDNQMGGYHWGTHVKELLLKKESTQ